MNRLERLFRIHRLLQQRRPVPMAKFQASLGVSRTTITRDFEYLRDFMSAPIVYDREANGHHYDPNAPSFELPGFWLNQSELYALLATEQLLEGVQPGVLRPALGPLKSRVRALLGQAGAQADHLAERIHLLRSGSRSQDVEAFGQVAEAVLRERQLRFVYHSRSQDRVAIRHVDPQRLISYRHNWYLLASCREANAPRLFSLDRIRDVTVLDAAAERLGEAELSRFVSASFGIFSGEAAAWAVLRVSPAAARWVAEEQWHPDQIGFWRDAYYELQVPYSNPTELVMEVLRHGPDVEVLAPADLRHHVRERLRQAAARYQLPGGAI